MTSNRSTLQGYNIKVYTRSFSLEMYKKAKYLFDTIEVPCVRLTDQMADEYFYTMLKDLDCDIAINIDEDAFTVSPDAVLDIVEYVVINGYANAGCPDGGTGAPRYGNPIITNPFFNILNLRLIRSIPHSKTNINSFEYLTYRNEMETAFPKEMLFGEYDFAKFDYEPYYPFFFWLARNFMTLYLPSKLHRDGISTILYNHKNEELCYHSWFARFYNINPTHTKRINALFDEVRHLRKMIQIEFTLQDKLQFGMDFLLRRLVRVPMRIANWPNKWRKWYKHYRISKNRVNI